MLSQPGSPIWSHPGAAIGSHPAGGQPTISFAPSTGREFRVLITMIKQTKKEMNDLKRVKAFVDIVVNDAILIKGIRVIEGKKGMFVSMPSEQGKDEKWYDRVRCLSDEVKDLVSERVLEGYRLSRHDL